MFGMCDLILQWNKDKTNKKFDVSEKYDYKKVHRVFSVIAFVSTTCLELSKEDLKII